MAGKDSNNSRGPPPSGLPNAEKLPDGLQKIVDKADKEENFYDELYDGWYVSMRPFFALSSALQSSHELDRHNSSQLFTALY